MKSVALLLLLLLQSCSTLISSRAIEASDAPAEDRRKALELYRDGLELANAFLASEDCLSLPQGQFEETTDGSLAFVTPERGWPIRIRHSFGGDLVVSTGYRAQEREDGFVVGVRPPARHLETDNSMFRYSDGDWVDAESVARLILHETAHTVHGVGTVGVWNTLAYYAEAIFLLRSAKHSAETLPRATSYEFMLHRFMEEARESEDREELDFFEQALSEHAAKIEARGGPLYRRERSSRP